MNAGLGKSRDSGELPPKEHLSEDTDLDSIRDEAWFKEFMQGLDD